MTPRIIDARRCRFAGTIAALAVLAAAGGAHQATAQQGATPRVVPLSETVHGVTLADEYRWMEDPANAAEMLAFVEAENTRFRGLIDARGERAWFERRLGEVSSSLDRIGDYLPCGDNALVIRAGASDRVPKLYLRDAKGERLFLDAAKVAGNELASFGALKRSPDCRLLSAQVSVAGAESGQTHIFDIATGRQIGQPVARIWGEFETSFLPGNQILYTQMAAGVPAGGDPMQGMTAYVAPLDGSRAPVAVLGNGLTVQAKNFPLLTIDPGERFAMGIAGGARADNEFFVTPMDALVKGAPRWRQVATLADKVDYALIHGGALFVQTTQNNDAATVLRYPLAADGAAMGAGTAVFTGTPERLVRAIAATRDGVVVHTTSDGAAKLWLLPGGTGAARALALPFEGSVLGMGADADGRNFNVAFSGWLQNITVLRLEGDRLLETGIASTAWAGARDMAVTRMEATSADGTSVPLVVMRRKGTTGRVPTIVEAYGGYGIDTVYPAYDRNSMAWLDKGGAFAYCGTRGGGERGRAWHEGGRAANKPRAMEDLAACARALTSAGIAPVQGPVSFGGSMAGTVIPTAALRDPGAFGAMVTGVGIVNPARIAAANNGANQFDEMGSPADPAQYRGLVAMDAYHMVATAAAPPPPSLMVIGLNDKRVAPWMTAKWMARARAKWPDAPIYMRGDAKAGHGIGSAEDVRRAQTADVYAFAWAQQTR